MSPEQIAAIVDRIKYKPNWAIKITRDCGYFSDKAEFSLRIVAMVPDVITGRVGPVMMEQVLPYFHFDTEKQVLDWVFEEVSRMELHEQREFFKVDGKPHQDPHPELTRHEKQNQLTMREPSDKTGECKPFDMYAVDRLLPRGTKLFPTE